MLTRAVALGVESTSFMQDSTPGRGSEGALSSPIVEVSNADFEEKNKLAVQQDLKGADYLHHTNRNEGRGMRR